MRGRHDSIEFRPDEFGQERDCLLDHIIEELPRDIRRGDPLRQCFAASSLALGVACLTLRDVPLFVQRHSLSPIRMNGANAMGYSHNYQISSRPQALPPQAAAGARQSCMCLPFL